MNEFRTRLAERGIPFTETAPPAFPGPLMLLTLRRVAPTLERVSVAKRLHSAGVTLREGHAVALELAGWRGVAPVRVAESVDLAALRAGLAALGVETACC